MQEQVSIFRYTYIACLVLSLNEAVLSHRNPASAGTLSGRLRYVGTRFETYRVKIILKWTLKVSVELETAFV